MRMRRSEEHTSELQSPFLISYAVFCLKKKNLVLALGTGDWWLQATLAARQPRFGIADPVLHRDLDYYVAQLPWSFFFQTNPLPPTTTQGRALFPYTTLFR